MFRADRDPEEQRSGTRSYMAKALAELSVAAAASCEKAGVRPPSPSGGTPDPWPALPEDVELRGYAPLAAFQQGVDYYRTAGPEVPFPCPSSACVSVLATLHDLKLLPSSCHCYLD